MADFVESDRKLREEFVSFGENVGKITDRNRAILIKKLNHLKARQRAAELPPSPVRGRGRSQNKNVHAPVASSVESHTAQRINSDKREDTEKVSEVTSKNLRRRTVDSSLFSGDNSPKLRPGRRSVGPLSSDSPFSAGSLLSHQSGGHQSRRIQPSRSTPVRSTGYEFSDEDASFSDDEYTYRETVSMGVNTTQSLEKSIEFGYGNPEVKPLNGNVKGTSQKFERVERFRAVFRKLFSGRRFSLPRICWHTISKLLVGCVVLFFLAIIGLYVFAINSSDHSNEVSLLLLCPTDGPCNDVPEKEVALDIAEILSKQAGEYDCGQLHESHTRYMSLATLSDVLVKQYGKDDKRNIEAAVQLISQCPKCGIRLLDESIAEVKDVKLVRYLESLAADKSLWCRLSLSIQKVFGYILVCAAGLVLTFVIGYLCYWWTKAAKEEAKEVNKLVEDIIVLLKNHAAACRNNPSMLPFVAIPHARDALIPIAERSQKQTVWSKAARLLSTNDSRVREEVRIVDGEECFVWRWVDTIPAYPEGVAVTAVRAQQSNGSASPAIKPKSSCLRICNMIDPSRDYDESAIRDAVLDQCGSHAGILHVAVYTEVPDGVYVKFVSESAAGQACKSLHGWTYNGKLTSVKEVSAMMYRTMFPESADAMVPLRSSASRRLSSSFAMPSANYAQRTPK